MRLASSSLRFWPLSPLPTMEIIMFFQRLASKPLTTRGRPKKHERRVRPRVEVLEDRFLLAQTYTWSGPADGLWSQATNWVPNNGPPGPADTALFINTDNNNCVADLPNPGLGNRVGVLKIDGYTGTIKLQNSMSVDVLTMTSGTIAQPFGGGNLFLDQAIATIFNASSWTGGNIGGGTNLDFRLAGSPDHPLTLNVSDATSTPTFAGAQWLITGPPSTATVNWNQGNINMIPVGTLGAEVLNAGTFNALSTGKMTAPAGKKWMFTNGAGGTGNLVLPGEKQFERCHFTPRPGSNTFKKAGLDGTPGTFTLVGDVDQEGGNVLVQSGTFAVTEGYTENAGTVALSADTTLAITGAMAENGGTLTIGENTNGATLTATNGVQVAAGAVLSGWGSIVANVSNSGEVDKQGGTLAITGTYTQLSGATTNMYGGTFHVSSNLVEQGGTFTLTGTVQADLGMLIQSGALLYGNGTINVIGALTNAGTINLAGGSGPSAIPGILAVNGDFTQTSTGILDVHLYGDGSSDALQVAGLATLDGTLNVIDNGNYRPSAGQVFVVLTYGSLSGTFAGISLPDVSFGHWDNPHWDDPSYPNALSLWVLYP
jgi:hypothetical protein